MRHHVPLWELRTATVLEVITGCWANHRNRTSLHCCRAGEWDHQITLDRGPQCTMACTRRQRASQLAQIYDGAEPYKHRNTKARSCMKCGVGMEASAIHPALYWDMWSNFLKSQISSRAGEPASTSPSEPLGDQR